MFNTVPDTQGNPIFGSYSTRSANFNENMDEFVKAPNDLYIEEQQKKQTVKNKKNINNEALNNIPDMPDFLREEYDEAYRLPEWLEKLNVATPEEIEEWKSMGGMGIAEAWEKNNKWRAFVPYANTTTDAAEAITASVLLNRAKKGEELTEQQKEILVDYLRELKELQVRGFTFGGGTVNAILTSIPYLEEFGIGLATSEGGVGLASLGKTITTLGGKRAARKAVEKALKEAAIKSAAPAAAKTTVPLSVAKSIYRDTLAKTTTAAALRNVTTKEALSATGRALPQALASSTKFALTKMPHTFVGGIADRQLSTGVYVTDYGDAVFTSSEHLATSIMKALGESTFEALTETAGWTLTPVASYFAKPIQKIMPKKFFTDFEKLVTSRYGMPAAQVLKKYGYDGVIEEMGEELLNRFLCQTFGINGLDEYNFDGFMNNVLYADNPSQWGQEALSFAAVGAAGHAVAGTQSRIADEWNKRQYQRDLGILAERANKYLYSPEQFYLEQGLIKIKGSQSLAEQKLRDIWSAKNVDESLQDDVLKNMSETEIRSELKKTIENQETDNTPEAATERIEKDLTERFMENKTFNNEKQARTVAALFAAPLQKLSETTGLSLSEVMEEEMPDIQREAEQAARDNGRYIQVDGRIEEIFNELNELPDNFNDEKYLERLIKEVDILSKARDGILTDTEREEAIQFTNLLQQNGEVEFADELKEILNIENGEQLFQSASLAGAENNEIEAAKKEWQEKGTESKYFKKWFGDSKVVDENGEPLIVYHGTNADFDTFSYDKIGETFGKDKAGFFFTSVKSDAENYADYAVSKKNMGSKNIYPVYVSLQNPLTLKEWAETRYYNNVQDYIDNNGDPIVIFDSYTDEIIEFAKNNNYDGIFFNDRENSDTIVVAFNSEQIKSVNNQGTFDAENPNIYYQSEIDRENIETSFGDTLENITDAVKADVLNIAVENNLSEDEFNFEDIRVYGSYSKGQNKDTSDLDFLVQYSGSMREDDAFNMFADAELTLEDVNGNTVKIDINPVNVAKSGTIDDHLVDMDALYQEDNNKLIMAHATKAERIDDIIESGEFVAPSLSITRKGSAELSTKKFGDVLFLRNPRRIDFQNDNIYDRDIYSPRLPEPDYKLTNGTTVNAYEYSSMQREWKGNPERFIQRYGKSFDEYFKDAEKVLFMGYTHSGNRRYKPYKPNFILEYIKKNKLVGGENANYGLSSFLARLAKKQTSKDLLKRAANEGLKDRENAEEEYDKLRDEYADLMFGELGDYYRFDGYSWQKISDEDFTEIMHAVATNNKRKLNTYIDTDRLPKELYNKLKDFTKRALSLPRSYFEAKPLRKVDLSEFPYAIAEKGTLSDKQIKGLKDWGVTVVEYEDGEMDAALQKVEDTFPEVYFQSAYHGTPHRFDEFSTEHIGSGEGSQAHGWGLYFAENREVSEDYRKILSGDYGEYAVPVEIKYNGQDITEINDNADLSFALEEAKNNGLEAGITYLKNEILKINDRIDLYKRSIEKIKKGEEDYFSLDEYKEGVKDGEEYIIELNKLIDFVKSIDLSKLEVEQRAKGQLYKVDIPESNVLLDEDKELIEQPKEVQRIIEKMYSDFAKSGNLDIAHSFVQDTGGNLYKALSKTLGSDREASLLLNKYGIKGITYNGRSDGRCYVVFDDKAIKVLETYYQGENEPIQTNMIYDNISPRRLRNMNIKGAFVPAENLIELFKNADESTIIHEFAHWWLSRLEKYAPNSEELALDLEEVRKFVKNEGGAFTREQHEKFARGFEAYIRNGSAKNNRLKRIFEDFKNALIQIYDSIKQLVYTEDGQQYSFSEADVANLERLFERLLTTENERIKKTVFDRCDDINDRIQQIKERQEEEMRELDELWKGNIEANNRASDKKRQVQEYLDLAEGAVSKVPKEVKELKKRYKDVTLSILSVATGYDKRYIANPRNWERVQLALENADDKITTSGGMRGEWQEFYTDTGVSYENDEIGGDYELAQQAFDVLTTGTYDFNNQNEDDIGRFYGKFEYLYGKVLSLKGEEKSTALEALYSLFNDMPSMPDEVTADIVEKLSKVEAAYEEGQREDFNRRRYPNIPVVQQLQYYVTNKLSELKVYDPNVRYKVRISKSHSLYKAIKHATSVNETKKIVRRINEYVISDLENQAKSILHKEIQKQIKTSSKLVKVGTLKKGKFDWKTNTVFAELAEMNKMKQKDAFKEYAAAVEFDRAAAGEDREYNDENIVSTPQLETDFQSNLKRKFLEYRSSKIKDLNLAATRSLLEDIMTLKFEGRRAKDAQELEKRLQKDNMKTDLAQRVRVLKGNRLAKNVAKFIMGENLITSEKTLVNWETALNALFGKEVAQRYSLLKLESDAEVYAFKHYNEFCRKAIDIYGLNNPTNARERAWNAFNKFVDFANIQPLVKLMQEYEEEVYNYKEVTYSKETGEFVESGVQLSRAEIITLYAWSLNEELEQRLFTQYGVNQVRHMFNEVLSDKDKQLAWLLIDTCEKMYDENNEVFIRTMGLSLPKVQNYFPSKTVRVGSEIDMLHENMVRSNNPSFIKQRKVCSRIKMKPEQPLSILLPHINKTARYVILSERVNYLNAIFKDGTVRAAIKEVFDGVETPDGKTIKAGQRAKGKRNKKNRTLGDRIHDTLLNQLGCSTFENYARGINVGKSFMDYVATNYITSRIGGNLKVAFGQLTSMINYCENMPNGLWAKGFVECLTHPKETIKFMLDNCPYLEARLAGNSMNEIMQRITDETDKFRTLRNFCCTNTKYGDLIAISFGGKPYVDYLMSQGMSKEEAFEKFVEDTMRSQQAGQASATSIWQKKQAENPLSRMMFAFNNTTLQYERKFLDAIASRARGDISTKEFVKALLIYKVFNPLLFSSFLTNLSFMTLIRGLSGGDDDGVEKFGVDVISSMLFANLAAYGYLGMGLSTIGAFLLTLIDKKEYKPFLKTIPIIGDLEKIGKKILMKNEITLADYIDAMALVVDDTTGIPATRLVNSAGGVGDILEGEFGVGLSRIFGYGEYRANQAWKGETP